MLEIISIILSAISLFSGKLERMANDHSIKLLIDKNDELIRDNLKKSLSEYAYEEIDRFASENNLYSSQRIDDPKLSSQQLLEIEDAFFRKHSNLISLRSSLAPQIRDLANASYQALFSCLDNEHKILLRQGQKQYEQGERTSSKIDELDAKLGEIINLQTISDNDAQSLCALIENALYDGKFKLARSAINALRSKSLSRKVQGVLVTIEAKLDYFSCGDANYHGSVDNVIETKNENLVEMVVAFLAMVDDSTGLLALIDVIQNPVLSEVLMQYTSMDAEAFIASMLDNGAIKTKYQEHQTAYYTIANAAIKLNDLNAANTIFRHLKSVESIDCFDRWQALAVSSRLYIAQSPLAFAKQTHYHDFRVLVFSLLTLVNFFCETYSDLKKKYLLSLQESMVLLSYDDYTSALNTLPRNIVGQPEILSATYENKLRNNQIIREEELIEFCLQTKDFHLLSSFFRVLEDAKRVVTFFLDHKDCLEESFQCLTVFTEAIEHESGIEKACEHLRMYQMHHEGSVNYRLLQLDLNLRAGLIEANETVESIFRDAKNDARLRVSDVYRMVSILKLSGRHVDIIDYLDNLSENNAAIQLYFLEYLMNADIDNERCMPLANTLIQNTVRLEKVYYYRGLLRERKTLSAGLPDFEASFSALPNLQSALYILNIRYQEKIIKIDGVLQFAEQSDDSNLQYITAITYKQLEQLDKAFFHLHKALLLNGNKYVRELFNAYMALTLSQTSADITITRVEKNTIVVLKEEKSKKSTMICVHGEEGLVPIHGSTFADCQHVWIGSSEGLLLRNRKKGNTVVLAEKNYSIVEIKPRSFVFFRYCLSELTKHGDVTSFTMDDPDGIFEVLKRKIAETDMPLNLLLQEYNAFNKGMTVALLARAVGKNYSETIFNLLFDPKGRLWAGRDQKKQHEGVILSLSAICVLASLKYDYPNNERRNVQSYISAVTKRYLASEVKEILDWSERSVGSLHLLEGEQLYMHQKSDEEDVQLTELFHCATSIADILVELHEMDPIQWPEELQTAKNGLGSFDCDSMALAKLNNYTLVSDDAVVISLSKYLGINCINSVALIMINGAEYSTFIGYINKLLDYNYFFPVTPETILYISKQFDAVKNEDELENVAIPTLDLFNRLMESEEFKPHFMITLNEIHEAKIKLNSILFQYLTTILVRDSLINPEIYGMVPSGNPSNDSQDNHI